MKWIDIKEQLPPLGQGKLYLVCLADGEICLDRYYAKMDGDEVVHSWDLWYQPTWKIVKYWMSIPELPNSPFVYDPIAREWATPEEDKAWNDL